MTKFLFFCGTLLLSFPLFSQQINLNVCNETSNIAARNSCIKGYIESLLVNEFDTLRDSIGPATVDLKLSIDPVGNMQPTFFKTNEPILQDATQRVIQKIRPLESFRNSNGEFLIDEIAIHLESPFPKMMSEKYAKENKKEKDMGASLPFAVIERVPVFPGCYSSDNKTLKTCMSTYVQKHTVNNFNTNVAKSIGLPTGRVRISVQFKINKEGYVVDVRARAQHPALEAEAVRVTQAIPRMQPGTQRGQAVGVLYSLPILFQYEESFKDRKDRLKRERKAARDKS